MARDCGPVEPESGMVFHRVGERGVVGGYRVGHLGGIWMKERAMTREELESALAELIGSERHTLTPDAEIVTAVLSVIENAAHIPITGLPDGSMEAVPVNLTSDVLSDEIVAAAAGKRTSINPPKE
jgi:hypothetical protein